MNYQDRDFSGHVLSPESFRDCTLYNSKLVGADVTYCDFSLADARHCDFTNTNARYTRFTGADLRFANFKGADIRYAGFNGADLRDAEFLGANLNWQSHDLLAAILRKHATTFDRLCVAGYIKLMTGHCWDHFLSLKHPEKAWALGVLKQYALLDPAAPDIFGYL